MPVKSTVIYYICSNYQFVAMIISLYLAERNHAALNVQLSD